MNWKTEKRLIADLIPYSKNPRQLSEKQAKDLEKSLTKFNLVEIPVINTDGTIIAGHQRLSIMQLLGRGKEEIEVRVPDKKLTEKEVKEYNIRSNKNTGGWDYDILANDFEYDDLLEWGFSDEELTGNNFEVDLDTEIKEKELDENIETDHECPKCGYKW